MPRILRTLPSSTNIRGFNCRTIGTLSVIWPPPSGGAPRFCTFVESIGPSWALPLIRDHPLHRYRIFSLEEL